MNRHSVRLLLALALFLGQCFAVAHAAQHEAVAAADAPECALCLAAHAPGNVAAPAPRLTLPSGAPAARVPDASPMRRAPVRALPPARGPPA